MNVLSQMVSSVGGWLASLNLDEILTGVQNFLDQFGKIARAFFEMLP